jgi:hypothetical protein
MLARLDREVAAWNKADPSLPVQPALHLIATVAQGSAGKDGKWRYRVHPGADRESLRVGEAKERAAVPRRADRQEHARGELAVLAPYLQRPDVHLGIDPEFAMTKGGDPGRRVGTYDARHINQAIDYLADLVTKHRLPPKVFVVHRFTGPMVTNSQNIKLDPRVQVVMHMDGWGPPYGKRATWARYIRPYPCSTPGSSCSTTTTRRGHPLMQPQDVLALRPRRF